MQNARRSKVDLDRDVGRGRRGGRRAKVALIDGAAGYEVERPRRRLAGLSRRPGRVTDDREWIYRRKFTGNDRKKAKQNNMQRNRVKRQ
jgi:hypothetical protein